AEDRLGEIAIVKEVSDGTLSIQAPKPGLYNSSVAFDIKVPMLMDIAVDTSNGSITILNASVAAADTSNGTVTIEGPTSEIDVDTSNGRINLDATVAARVKAKTSNGRITWRGPLLPGKHQLGSSNGSIYVTLVGTPANISGSTSNGSVTLGGVKKRGSQSGVVGGEMGTDQPNLSISTSNGSVTVTHEPLQLSKESPTAELETI
ncbi:MAG: DUF4097 family beta strand repeat-containing protein, partial [Planctomycetota bacterium]